MKPKLSEILSVALKALGVDYADWENYCRTRQSFIVKVKELYSLLAYEQGYSHSQIGAVIHSHRTSVIHNINALRDHCSVYPQCRELVDYARSLLQTYITRQLKDVSYGYLARAEKGFLTISPVEPRRICGCWIAEGTKPYYPQSAFPQITWECDPVKVKITVTIEDNEKM